MIYWRPWVQVICQVRDSLTDDGHSDELDIRWCNYVWLFYVLIYLSLETLDNTEDGKRKPVLKLDVLFWLGIPVDLLKNPQVETGITVDLCLIIMYISLWIWCLEKHLPMPLVLIMVIFEM